MHILGNLSFVRSTLDLFLSKLPLMDDGSAKPKPTDSGTGGATNGVPPPPQGPPPIPKKPD
jgi:hypothetical protein